MGRFWPGYQELSALGDFGSHNDFRSNFLEQGEHRNEYQE